MKRCSSCREMQPLSNFCKHSGMRDGLGGQCKSCRSAYRKANRHKKVAYDRAYRAANPERARKQKNQYNEVWCRSLKYGKPRGWYEEQLAAQGGVCAICGSPPKRNRLHIDHDHTCCAHQGSCGSCVRGIVCAKCNGLLSAIENPDFMAAANRYLTNYRVGDHS